MAKVRSELETTRWSSGEIVAYLNNYEKHILMTGKDEVKMVDLSKPSSFMLSPMLSSLTAGSSAMLAESGTHLKSCVVCFKALDKEADGLSGFANFCYVHYHVDGHEVDIQQPRHPGRLCHDCLKRHCETGLQEGKLYVRCPIPHCNRALQIRELQGIVSEEIYETLMVRLREAEEQEQEQGVDDQISSLGLELKQCPRCKVRIEKNQGCTTMQCYRCGHTFDWRDAKEVQPRFRAQGPVAAGDELGADGEDREAEAQSSESAPLFRNVLFPIPQDSAGMRPRNMVFFWILICIYNYIYIYIYCFFLIYSSIVLILGESSIYFLFYSVEVV